MDDATTEPQVPTSLPTTDDGGDEPARPSQRITRDRYKIGEELARGGMGIVVTARDEQIGRDVAIKLMRARVPSDRAIQRFVREAKIQGRLEHPAIVPVHELGRDASGRPFFAMKKLAGTTLRRTTEGRSRLLRALADVCLAIELAHTRGVIHRDLKPDNIMLGDFGEVYVLDWGVAKVLGESDDALSDVESGEDATRVGATIGTPGYMSPEQEAGAPDLDARADVYALGCVLFEILAGVPLHRGNERRPSLRAPDRDIPPELDDVCVNATALDRTQRIASARALADQLQRYVDGDRDHTLRRTRAVDHLATARRALDTSDRAGAMREAGLALALDPLLTDAASLVGKLLLEPPPELPPEVVAEIAQDDLQTILHSARMAAPTYLGVYVIALPLMLMYARAPWPYVLAFAGLGLLLAGTALRYGARGRSSPVVVIALANVAVVALIAHMFTPFLVAPAAAIVTSVGLAQNPLFADRRLQVATVVAFIAAIIGVWACEATGVLQATTHFTDGAVVMTNAVVSLSGTFGLLMELGFVVVAIPIAVLLVSSLAARERATRDQLHVLGWHLRQILPQA